MVSFMYTFECIAFGEGGGCFKDSREEAEVINWNTSINFAQRNTWQFMFLNSLCLLQLSSRPNIIYCFFSSKPSKLLIMYESYSYVPLDSSDEYNLTKTRLYTKHVRKYVILIILRTPIMTTFVKTRFTKAAVMYIIFPATVFVSLEIDWLTDERRITKVLT